MLISMLKLNINLRKIFLFWFYLIFTLIQVIQCFGPKKLYSMNVDSSLVSVNVINKKLMLVGSYYIGEIENIQWKYTQPNRMKIEMLNTDIPDPRYVGGLPSGVVSSNSRFPFYWVSSWASNVSDGHIAIIRRTQDYSEWKNVDVGSGWSYDRSIWVDMNRDGLKDCLTARYRDGVGQLIYFQQPGGQSDWNQFIINEGEADGNFKTIRHYKRNYIIVAANQFSSLSVFWTTHPKKSWEDAKRLRKNVVDNYGKYYDIQHIDLNNDGRKDILTSTLKIDDSRGQVLGYDLPNDLRYGKWQRHVLAAGFNADYSPGKAIAYFPNKFKAKNERPSVFLTGGAAGKLYILSPRPKSKGWSYVKTSIDISGDGPVGIPWIGDLNGDSYPEIFVPQSSKLHVFAYDYASSVKEPPAQPINGNVKVSKTPVKYRSAYFRPTKAPKTPKKVGAKKKKVGDVSLDQGSTKPFYEGDDPNDSTNKKPSGEEGSKDLSPNESSRPPLIPQGGRNMLPPRKPLESDSEDEDSANSENKEAEEALPRYKPTESPTVNRPKFRVTPSDNNNIPSKPINPLGNTNYNTNGGRIVLPNYQRQPPQGFQTPAKPTASPFLNNQNSLHQNNSRIVYYIIPNQPQYQAAHPGNSQSADNPQIPVTSTTISPSVDYQEPFFNLPRTESSTTSTTELPTKALILEVSEENFSFYEQAEEACLFHNRKLCSLSKLQEAVNIEKVIPDTIWGWFEVPGRAAKLESCTPGEVKYTGYECYNGDLAHIPIFNDASLPAFCCATVNVATFTAKKFQNIHDAEDYCNEASSHLCYYDEMKAVWSQSTYKGLAWGWFSEPNMMIRMTDYCNEEHVLWSGYSCSEGIFELSTINSLVEESAYCCVNSSAFVFRSFYWIVIGLNILIKLMMDN